MASFFQFLILQISNILSGRQIKFPISYEETQNEGWKFPGKFTEIPFPEISIVPENFFGHPSFSGAGEAAHHGTAHCVLVLVLIKDPLTIKRMLTLRHPFTRASFLCQGLQSDTGKRMLSSPPASPLPKYGRNRIRAGRRTKTQPKRVIRANVCLVRHPCHNR